MNGIMSSCDAINRDRFGVYGMMELPVDILTFETTPFATNCYVVKHNDQALVIDAGELTVELRNTLDGMEVIGIINTHGHCDHCGGNAALVRQTQAPLWIHEADRDLLQNIVHQGMMFGLSFEASPAPTGTLAEGDTVTIGDESLEVRHTPGHSPGHIVLVGDGCVLGGDVLFAGSIGRTDLPGGNHHQLLDSIRTQLLPLPDDTVVYPGHGPVTTIGTERGMNPFLREL